MNFTSWIQGSWLWFAWAFFAVVVIVGYISIRRRLNRVERSADAGGGASDADAHRRHEKEKRSRHSVE
jgi:membrane protein implicated in regulation of membrane protease activity